MYELIVCECVDCGVMFVKCGSIMYECVCVKWQKQLVFQNIFKFNRVILKQVLIQRQPLRQQEFTIDQKKQILFKIDWKHRASIWSKNQFCFAE